MENIDDLELSRLNDITIDEVKSLPLFAHFTDEQAIEVVQTVQRLAEIVYRDYLKNNVDGD